ncbi:CBU_0592 family membrane protein [Pedobacter duraquae]|uniref:CBU-0592-like domain-containing protein n=1 Tax=Pedobacter duraquae TaxID=425511 RepID=A0A4R6ICK1_9SPHI|nr:hypothetical protein [Pedobacter duraquae]TDO19228.1 hypothetical protein CLV32_4467 [Pedobacter duraquae]
MATSDLIATLGVSILLLAFLLQILKVISPQSLLYSSLNLVGSALAGYSSWLIGFMPFVILETVWAIVSLYGVVMSLKNKRST